MFESCRARHTTGSTRFGRGIGTRASATGIPAESPRNGSSETLQMVAVAQLVSVLDCDSRCRGFESPQPPQFRSPMAGRRDDCTPTAMIAGGEKSLSSEENTSELQSLMRSSYAG